MLVSAGRMLSCSAPTGARARKRLLPDISAPGRCRAPSLAGRAVAVSSPRRSARRYCSGAVEIPQPGVDKHAAVLEGLHVVADRVGQVRAAGIELDRHVDEFFLRFAAPRLVCPVMWRRICSRSRRPAPCKHKAGAGHTAITARNSGDYIL